MAGFFHNLIEHYSKAAERNRNRSFLRAVMAACAGVYMADGVVTLRDRMRLDKVMETLKALQVYDPHEGVDLFNEFVDAIKAHPKTGNEQVMRVIRDEAAGDTEKSNLLIRICLAVSEVKGEIPLPEQVEIVSLCNLLDVHPDGVGLYTDTKQ